MTDETDIQADADAAADEKAAMRTLLSERKSEHRQVDNQIEALINIGAIDMLKIGRMKKVKLSLKDQIAYLENQLIPDIIA